LYSTFYYYFEIRTDSYYRGLENTDEVKRKLSLFIELSEKSNIEYESKTKQFLNLCLLKADQNGNYSSNEGSPKYINLISVVASKSSQGGEKRGIIALLKKIAQQLKWQLIEEEDEEGNEGVILWSPEQV
jgi:hypothetical protein